MRKGQDTHGQPCWGAQRGGQVLGGDAGLGPCGLTFWTQGAPRGPLVSSWTVGVGEGQGLHSNVSQPRGTLVSVLLLLLLLLLSLVFSWLLFTQVNILKGTCCILLTLFLSCCIRQTIPGITRRLHLGQVIELQVIELDRWGVWAQKSKMVRTALILQCRPFAPELEYSLALK